MKRATKHNRIQSQIAATCDQHGSATAQEYRGEGWRADIFATSGSKAFAFEVQLSSQSLEQTISRQARYSQAGATCCWLFQRPAHRLTEERPDLPLFYVAETEEGEFRVSLSGRRDVPLRLFTEQFLEGGIRFCHSACTKEQQSLTLVFYEMACWKCGAMNHLYFIDGTLLASCNAEIQPDEELWGSNRLAHRPEIVETASRLLSSPEGNHLRLGEIKPRYSKTVQEAYLSFGCHACDSIFGDWFVMNAELDAMNGYGQIASFDTTIQIEPPITLPLPH